MKLLLKDIEVLCRSVNKGEHISTITPDRLKAYIEKQSSITTGTSEEQEQRQQKIKLCNMVLNEMRNKKTLLSLVPQEELKKQQSEMSLRVLPFGIKDPEKLADLFYQKENRDLLRKYTYLFTRDQIKQIKIRSGVLNAVDAEVSIVRDPELEPLIALLYTICCFESLNIDLFIAQMERNGCKFDNLQDVLSLLRSDQCTSSSGADINTDMIWFPGCNSPERIRQEYIDHFLLPAINVLNKHKNNPEETQWSVDELEQVLLYLCHYPQLSVYLYNKPGGFHFLDQLYFMSKAFGERYEIPRKDAARIVALVAKRYGIDVPDCAHKLFYNDLCIFDRDSDEYEWFEFGLKVDWVSPVDVLYNKLYFALGAEGHEQADADKAVQYFNELEETIKKMDWMDVFKEKYPYWNRNDQLKMIEETKHYEQNIYNDLFDYFWLLKGYSDMFMDSKNTTAVRQEALSKFNREYNDFSKNIVFEPFSNEWHRYSSITSVRIRGMIEKVRNLKKELNDYIKKDNERSDQKRKSSPDPVGSFLEALTSFLK